MNGIIDNVRQRFSEFANRRKIPIVRKVAQSIKGLLILNPCQKTLTGLHGGIEIVGMML